MPYYESTEKPLFLNVDVDLRTMENIDDLILALEPEIFLLNKHDGLFSFELTHSATSIEDVILELVRIIKTLPSREEALWNRCESREANVGIRAGRGFYQSHFTISQKAVSLLQSVRMGIVFTIYSPEEAGSAESSG